MMRQRSKVTFSQYQARYSPLTTLSRTITFFACQKASLVSNSQFSKTEFSMYWKEYLPLSFTPLKCKSLERIMKYSLSAVQFSISQPRTLQPNSGDTMSQPRILTSAHSRRALMPCIFVSVISTPSLYQSAARHLSVSSEPLILRPRSCQNG